VDVQGVLVGLCSRDPCVDRPDTDTRGLRTLIGRRDVGDPLLLPAKNPSNFASIYPFIQNERCDIDLLGVRALL
jgi:hypothetical protein